MQILNKLLFKNQRNLKITIAIIVVFFIFIYNLIGYFYFQHTINEIILDFSITIIISTGLIALIFYSFNQQKKQLNEQIEQLAEAYQYIGKINRKIDALLELDIASLDRSKKYSLNEASSKIFKQLLNLINARTGYLYLKSPIEFKIFHGLNKNNQLKKFCDLIAQNKKIDFHYSKNREAREYFKNLNINENLLKKYDLITKPVYMHDKDIGVMLFFFDKKHFVEERDLNIIRVFSFYLALNYTFKPDLSIYQA